MSTLDEDLESMGTHAGMGRDVSAQRGRPRPWQIWLREHEDREHLCSYCRAFPGDMEDVLVTFDDPECHGYAPVPLKLCPDRERTSSPEIPLNNPV